jgi:hypothetical protein
MTIIFRTPTQLDMRAITVFGINSKPNSKSPIGFFGTGLKYAISVLVREKQDVRIYIGDKSYRFYTKDEDFRDKSFNFVYMDRSDRLLFKQTERLPFTTELGKNWELWQAFRELHSNTLDEGGDTENVDDFDTSGGGGELQCLIGSNEGHTLITVDGNAFDQVYHDIDNIFHPKASRNRTDAPLEYWHEPSKYLYYRGMRVMELEKPSLLTYNILADLELTEDRTAKYSWQAEGIIRDYVLKEDKDLEFLRAIVDAKEGSYEHRFDYKSSYQMPSRAFSAYVASSPLSTPDAKEHARRYDPVTREAENSKPWQQKLMDSISADDDSYRTARLCSENREELFGLLKLSVEQEEYAIQAAEYDSTGLAEGGLITDFEPLLIGEHVESCDI